VAVVRDGIARPTSHYRVNGGPAVTLTVARERAADAVAVADAVKSALGKIAASPSAPRGLDFLLDADESAAVRAQLGDLGIRAALSAAAVFVVLLVALRSARLAAAVLGAGAVATLATVNALHAAGYTLNALTLLGLAMGVSLTVDGAIVVTENIVRCHRLGDPPARAAARGAGEVAVAAATSAATSLVVLLPFVYLQGELRAYYVPLAVAVGVNHAVSLLVSLMLLPVIVVWALGDGRAHPVFARRSSRPYRRLLTSSLRRPWVVLAPAALVAGGSGWLFVTVVGGRADWRPWAPPDRALVVTIALPYGEELEQADALARRVEARLRGEPGIARVVSSVHPRFAVVRVTFADSLPPSPVAHRVRERLVAFANDLGGAEVRVSGLAMGGGNDAVSPPTYALAILGYDYETVRAIAEGVGARLRRERRVRGLDVNATSEWHLRDRATEIVLRLDRAGLARHGLTARDVVTHVDAAIGADGARREVTLGGAAVHMVVGVQGGGELDVRDLERYLVPAGASAVRLGAIARIEERQTLSRIVREEQRYQRLVTYEFLGTPALGDRLRDGVVESTRLPDGYAIRAHGGRVPDDSRRQLWGVVAVAVALVYLVTAAMFESLRQPLCVLLTVPMALAGVGLLFACTGAPFTREAHAGVVVMVGIVANAAILLVHRINQLRGTAHSGGAATPPAPTLAAAIVRGTLDRARPILMTGAAAVAGFLPLATGGDGAGPSIWSGLSYALIGGLASSTLFVLTATPALYLLIERAGRRPRTPGHAG
jgi:HAE1 family hydrophobic/amphiphilic exporter-1